MMRFSLKKFVLYSICFSLFFLIVIHKRENRKSFQNLNFITNVINIDSKLLEHFQNENSSIYFCKTHKTAGSALQNVLFRVAKKRKLKVIKYNFEPTLNDVHKAKIFFNHIIHNRNRAENLFFRNASLYLTIIRNPIDQFISQINYRNDLYTQKKIIFANIHNENFIKINSHNKSQNLCNLRNSFSYDLGYVKCGDSYKGSKQELLKRVQRDFDLVLVSEYFEEGLILLKMLLNLEFEDIVCLEVNKGVRKSDRKEFDFVKTIISNISNADTIIYDFYVEKYKKLSVLLKDEVDELKRLNKVYTDKCTDGRKIKFYYSNSQFNSYVLKQNLSKDLNELCSVLVSNQKEIGYYIENRLN